MRVESWLLRRSSVSGQDSQRFEQAILVRTSHEGLDIVLHVRALPRAAHHTRHKQGLRHTSTPVSPGWRDGTSRPSAVLGMVVTGAVGRHTV